MKDTVWKMIAAGLTGILISGCVLGLWIGRNVVFKDDQEKLEGKVTVLSSRVGDLTQVTAVLTNELKHLSNELTHLRHEREGVEP